MSGVFEGCRLRIGRAALAIAFAAGLAGCAGTPSYDDPVAEGVDVVDRDVPALSAAEVRIFLADSTLTHVGDSRIWNVYLAKDGTLFGHSETADGAVERAKGSWTVQGDGALCRTWDNDWGGGTTGCARVFKKGTRYVFAADGSGKEIERTRTPGRSFK